MENNKALTDAEILQKVIDALNINHFQLSKAMGYGNHRSLYRIRDGESKINAGFEKKIKAAFPKVNLEFINTGVGSPLVSENEPEKKEEVQPNYVGLGPDAQLELQKINSRLSAIENDQFLIRQMIKEIYDKITAAK